MANRSYLYTSDHLPGSPAWVARKELRSIAEWNYDIPIAFRILLSGAPVAVRSSIWDTPDLIAIAGDAKTGLARLNAYMAVLPEATAPLVDETRAFFAKPENVKRHFILECGEIFDLSEGDMAEKNRALVSEIGRITDDVSKLKGRHALPADTRLRALFRRVLGGTSTRQPADPLAPFYGLGLGSWSDVLYFQFMNDEEA